MPADDAGPLERRWFRVISIFERAVVVFLMVLLMVVTGLAVLELGWLLFRDLSSTREVLLDKDELLQLFGFFLLVLIGVELLSALKGFIRSRMIHLEIVLQVALTAVAQKVIVLDTTKAGGLSLLGIAAIILALAAAYWSIRAARKRDAADG
jgi:uncharacterized membrane protein (DUF373 family)